MATKQLDYFIQLFVVAVAVHKDFKLRVASFGFSGLYVYKVDMVFLQETWTIIFELSTYTVYYTVHQINVYILKFTGRNWKQLCPHLEEFERLY